MVAGLFQEGNIEAGGPQQVAAKHLGPDLNTQQESMSHQKAATAAAAAAAAGEGWIGNVALPKVSHLVFQTFQLRVDSRAVSAQAFP